MTTFLAEETEIFDAVIVGSGATGGWAAKKLSAAGMKVAVLEAGRELDPNTDYTEHAYPFDPRFPLRNTLLPKKSREEQHIQKACYQCDEMTSHLFIKDTEHPYTTPADRPFFWIRGRHVGGKSITWARQSYRLSDYDFKAASRDDFGQDWPINYADLKPYYDEVEEFVGISGQEERLPQLPDSKFLPPMALTAGERMLKAAVMEEFGRTVTIGRCAILTKDLHGRPKCHYCGACSRGCVTGSYYSSPHSTLPSAEGTGNMTMMPNSIVSHLTVDDAGKARGVWVVDRISRNQREIRGKVIVMCASTLESTRILLNSKSAIWPDGIGNTSGVLGHYLMNHIMGGGAGGILPVLKGVKDSRGDRPNGIYIPRFRNIQDRHPGFLRGYGFQGGSQEVGWGHAYALPGFGVSLKEKARETPSWYISLSGFGECLPRFENHCRIDSEHVDRWGIPVLHIDAAFGENEHAMIEDMASTAAEMLDSVGALNIRPRSRISPPGLAIHEVGTARMGEDPKSSYLNRWNQSHEVKNLFVTDGSCYPSSACQNPTLTLMALTARACDYLVQQYRQGEL